MDGAPARRDRRIARDIRRRLRRRAHRVADAGAYAARRARGHASGTFGMAHLVTLDSLLSFWLTVALGALPARAARRRAGAARARRWMLVAWAAMARRRADQGPDRRSSFPARARPLYARDARLRAPWRRLRARPRPRCCCSLLAGTVVRARVERAIRSSRSSSSSTSTSSASSRPSIAAPARGGISCRCSSSACCRGSACSSVTASASWRDAPRDANGFAWARFCLVWIAFVFVFFSVSGSKLPSYILPMFPARRWSLGWQLDARCRSARCVGSRWPLARRRVASLLGTHVLGYDALVDRLADARTPGARLRDARPVGQSSRRSRTRLGYSLSALALPRGTERGKTHLGVVALSLGDDRWRCSSIFSGQRRVSGHALGRRSRDRRWKTQTDPPYDRSAPLFQVGMYDQTLPFYLAAHDDAGRVSRRARPRARRASREQGIAHEADWIARVASAAAGVCADRRPTRSTGSRSRACRMRVVARDPRRVLVARR